MKLLLYGIRSFGNLAMIVRSAEHFGLKHCYVYNDHERDREIIREQLADYPKGLQRRLIRVSGGAIARVRLEVILDYEAFRKDYQGRLIAASVTKRAVPIHRITFKPDDCMIFGTEAWGLSEAVLKQCEKEVIIPMLGQTQSLNLAVAAAIVLYEAARQQLSA